MDGKQEGDGFAKFDFLNPVCRGILSGKTTKRGGKMITHSFDPDSPAIISPRNFYGEARQLCDVCIITFSHVIFSHVLETFPNEQVAEIHACNGITPIYLLTINNRKIGFYLSHIGAAGAGTDVIECNHMTGATKFVMFGSAGNLNKEMTAGKYVVPSEAYRDEGMSYHYAAPADYIEVPGSALVSQVFEELKVPYVKGRAWTTDALYRETKNQTAQRQQEGCLAVEMELAGVQAVCDFHGLSLYDYLITGDVLDAEEYTAEGLREANHTLKHFYLALEIARKLI